MIYIQITLGRIFILFILCMNGTAFCATSEENFVKQLEHAKKIAELKGITTQLVQDVYFIDGSFDAGMIIVHYAGTASRTKYFVITPIVDMKMDAIYIDCSYKIGYDHSTEVVSVAGYCRGKKVEATLDSLEDWNGVQISYSSSKPWLKNVKNLVNCKSPAGLVYSGIYFVRCQNEHYDILTDNVKTIALSSNFDVLFTLEGYELAPTKHPKELMFWGFRKYDKAKDARYEFIKVHIPEADDIASYRTEKIVYTVSGVDSESKNKPSGHIKEDKAALYNSPNLQDISKMYLVRGDLVFLIDSQYIESEEVLLYLIEYTTAKNQKIRRWIRSESVEPYVR